MYRGAWQFDPVRNGWFGNPTRAAEVVDLMTSIKHKTGADGAERRHSLAMSKPFMDKLYAWSMKMCPVTQMDTLPADLETLIMTTEHLRFRAYAATGWTVWSR